MERNTQLHGVSLVLWIMRIPSPWQRVQHALASPIAFDRFHCILKNVLLAATLPKTRLSTIGFSTAFSTVSPHRKTSRNSIWEGPLVLAPKITLCATDLYVLKVFILIRSDRFGAQVRFYFHVRYRKF